MVRDVSVPVTLLGEGRVVETRPGVFEGGVPDPDWSGVAFDVRMEGLPALEREDEPMPKPVEGRIQLKVTATSAGYRELARYFLSLAELDATADPGFHDHQDDLVSADAMTTLHLVCHRR